MLTELVEDGCKTEVKVKAMQSEVKKINRKPTVKGRKPGLKSIRAAGRKKHSTRTE